MKRIGYTWNDEYREQFWSSPKVQAHLNDFIAQAKQPKSPETREKMRAAKLGKPKSAEHKANMSEAHKFRQSLKKEIVAKNPELPASQVWDLVRMAQAEEKS
jgi:hypothetical protein